MTTTVSNAVATRDNSPSAQVQQYKDDFVSVLPSHVKGDTWVRLAVGALRRDSKVREAASNNVGALMAALLTAARLGLEPGTEQFYLVPQAPKSGARPEIIGVVGYQGLVELMYRAGAVSSVIVECVYANDKFRYVPGQDARPVHEIDWDSDDRGQLRLAYAYAIMKDGATSKVVVLNRAQVNRIRQSSRSAKSEYSPWNKHEDSMWMKSAARQLAKWVPTSAEYMRERARIAQEAGASNTAAIPPIDLDQDETRVDVDTGEVIEAEYADEPTLDERP